MIRALTVERLYHKSPAVSRRDCSYRALRAPSREPPQTGHPLPDSRELTVACQEWPLSQSHHIFRWLP